MHLSITGRLRRLAERAGRVPSAGFALAYLAAIPFFAFFYYIFPDDFYHAAAKYDTTVRAQADAIAERVRDRYLTDAKLPSVRPPSFKERLWGPIKPSSQDFKLQFEGDHVQMVVSGAFPRRNTPGEGWFGTAVLDFGSVMFEKPERIDRDWETQIVSVNVKPHLVSGDEMDLSSVFPCHHRRAACLQMTMRDCVALTELQQTGAGRLSEEQNSYLRMLYFSAVTITTLGYGDIVPVTSIARGLVTIEIIVGPLLFGLFLNSLVKEGARA